MSKPLYSALMLGFLSSVVGATVGVAALGTAVSGAIVFGPMGAFLGWLLGSRTAAEPDVDRSSMGDTAPVPPNLSDDIHHVERTVSEASGGLVRMLAAIWNLEMRLISAFGAMALIQKNPWVLFLLAIVLTILVMPIGIFFSVTGMAAMHLGIRSETRFAVELGNTR